MSLFFPVFYIDVIDVEEAAVTDGAMSFAVYASVVPSILI